MNSTNPMTSRKLTLSDRLTSRNARFYVFVTMLAFIFLTGGGSRDDIQSLMFLRPLAILFSAYALWAWTPGALRSVRMPLILLLALAALMGLQLIPLPPSLWSSLPVRQIYAEIAEIAGIAQPWRPMTLSPSATINSLFSLTVPLAILLLFAIQDKENHRAVLKAFFILGTVSAILGILQVVSSDDSVFYLYRITNNGYPVGLFANRNHHSLLLAILILQAFFLAFIWGEGNKRTSIWRFFSLLLIAIFVPLVFLSGSRMGLLLCTMAILYGSYAAIRHNWKGGNIRIGKAVITQRNVSLIALGVAAFLLLVIIAYSQNTALERLLSEDLQQESRRQLLPIFIQMIRDYLPLGSGFGSFEHVYKGYEAAQLLSPKYLNEAHNDWAQFLIEGGIPGLAIIGGFLLWFARTVWQSTVKATEAELLNLGFFVLAIAFIIVTSAVDYPLRTPIIMGVLALLCGFLSSRHESRKRKVIPD